MKWNYRKIYSTGRLDRLEEEEEEEDPKEVTQRADELSCRAAAP